MRLEENCGLLAERDRLAAYAAVVLGAQTPAGVSARGGLSARDTVHALRRLGRGGPVSSVEGGLVAQEAAFKEAVREYAVSGGQKAPVGDLDPDRAKAAVLRAFVRDGRLVQIPVARGKRRIVLEHIAGCLRARRTRSGRWARSCGPGTRTTRRCGATWSTRGSCPGTVAPTGVLAARSRSGWLILASGVVVRGLCRPPLRQPAEDRRCWARYVSKAGDLTRSTPNVGDLGPI